MAELGDNNEGLNLDKDLDEAMNASESSEPKQPRKVVSKFDFSKLKMILDVPLKVSVEIGRTKMLVNDLLQLGQGSVIELDKIAGEPMEILINDKLVAMGEVVVVNEKFGVRLTDVVSQFGLSEMDDKEFS